MYPRFRIILIVMLIFLSLWGCASTPELIPSDLTPAEIIQRGQEYADRNRYSRALQYYDAILERFSYQIEWICAAEYEIAHIHYKQKKYELAKTELHDLLDRYNTPDEELLPPQFKVLAAIVLNRIADKELKGKKTAPIEAE